MLCELSRSMSPALHPFEQYKCLTAVSGAVDEVISLYMQRSRCRS